jgi:hypothetical protein
VNIWEVDFVTQLIKEQPRTRRLPHKEADIAPWPMAPHDVATGQGLAALPIKVKWS